MTCSLATHAAHCQAGMMPRVWYFDRELDAYAMLSFDMYTPKYRAGATTLFFFSFFKEKKKENKREWETVEKKVVMVVSESS